MPYIPSAVVANKKFILRSLNGGWNWELNATYKNVTTILLVVEKHSVTPP